MPATLTPQQSAFIEEMGQFLGGYGMTPMAGRMWAWLLLCDPPEQTAAEIAPLQAQVEREESGLPTAIARSRL